MSREPGRAEGVRGAARELVLVANARMPSQRAQSLQVAQAAASFARAGLRTTLLYARRHGTPAPREARELWSAYALRAEPLPAARAIPCVDWIDRVPRRLQYLPARAQELSFARNAARVVLREHPRAIVLARELEVVRHLARAGRGELFLELHRVPEGRARRRWLVEAARGASGILAISGGVREDLVELGLDPTSILVAHDAYDPERFERLPSAREARAELGLALEGPLVVYTGGLLAWKGVDLVVEAARELPEVQVVIAGGMDADVERLRARAEGLANLRIDGFQPPERVALYLAAADLGLAPNRSSPAISARHTSPLKVFEAMAAGLPLVASDLQSLRELLEHGKDAWLVPPDDARALAEGIRALLERPELRARFSERLRARSREHTWDARAARILAWMEERSRPRPRSE